jgi:hypothetical protein
MEVYQLSNNEKEIELPEIVARIEKEYKLEVNPFEGVPTESIIEALQVIEQYQKERL